MNADSSKQPDPKGVFRLTLDDETFEIEILAGETLLAAALKAGVDVPNSCTQGYCGSCMSLLREGDVRMDTAQALSKRDLDKGYILACQARPASADQIWLDFDS